MQCTPFVSILYKGFGIVCSQREKKKPRTETGNKSELSQSLEGGERRKCVVRNQSTKQKREKRGSFEGKKRKRWFFLPLPSTLSPPKKENWVEKDGGG